MAPKYRQLHVKILDSFDFAEMPNDFVRLFWVLLPLILDSEGRGIDNHAWIRAKMFPLRDDINGEEINGAMDWLERRGMILRYSAEGKNLFCVPTWKNYQTGTDKEAKSTFAPPDLLQTNSGLTPDLLQTNSGVGTSQPIQPTTTTTTTARTTSTSTAMQEISGSGGGKSTTQNIFAVYEQEIGPLTPIIGDELKLAEQEYPPDWIILALQTASRNNKRSWAYAHAILKRWKVEGFQSVNKPPGGNGRKSTLDKSLDAIKEFMEVEDGKQN